MQSSGSPAPFSPHGGSQSSGNFPPRPPYGGGAGGGNSSSGAGSGGTSGSSSGGNTTQSSSGTQGTPIAPGGPQMTPGRMTPQRPGNWRVGDLKITLFANQQPGANRQCHDRRNFINFYSRRGNVKYSASPLHRYHNEYGENKRIQVSLITCFA